MLSAQFGSEGWMNLLWIVLMFGMFFFGQRYYLYQISRKLEEKAKQYEALSSKTKRMLLNKLPNKSSRTVKESINRFSNFFVVEPVSLDPRGIVEKLEHLMDTSEERFEYFIENVAPNLDPEEKANLIMGVKGVIGVNQVSKVVRHFVETVKKTKNLQVAMMLQMQMPFIDKIIKSQHNGTEAFLKGEPVGDSIGPYMAASLVEKGDKEIEKHTMVAQKKIKGRTAYIMKAKGPGGRLGKLGRATETLMKQNKIAKIITIDAGLKLEGEKTGTVVEGVGVAMGGIGVDRSKIEEIAVKNKIPLDSIVIKMDMGEAIEPMRKAILDAEDTVNTLLEESIDRTPKNSKILIIGVGNTIGVGNKKSTLDNTRKMVSQIEKRAKKKEEEEKQKDKSFIKSLFKETKEYDKNTDW